jgi:uncharacterized protein
MQLTSFSSEIHDNLKYYVYRLIDPRNGETFYVGKGKGDRVFAHVNGALNTDESEDEYTLKIKTIREINRSGLEVLHIIHRHGMDEAQAFLAEAVLIDAIPGLTNLQNGKSSNDYGPANAYELQNRYKLDEFEIIPEHKLILISINRSFTEYDDIYNAVRFAWRMSLSKAQQADYVLAISQGIVRGVFQAEQWLEATKDNFPDRENCEGRIGFIGHRASENIEKHYISKRLPEAWTRKRGESNPIKYSY